MVQCICQCILVIGIHAPKWLVNEMRKVWAAHNDLCCFIKRAKLPCRFALLMKHYRSLAKCFIFPDPEPGPQVSPLVLHAQLTTRGPPRRESPLPSCACAKPPII